MHVVNSQYKYDKIYSFLGFIGLALASFLGCIDLTIVTTGLPAISKAMNSPSSKVQLVLGVFLAALSMFMVTAGRISDQKGRKGTLIIGLLCFILGSLGASTANSIEMLILNRFIQGASCAILYTSTSTLVESLFDKNNRSKAISKLYSINALGLAIGPLLGALLIPYGGWRTIFEINIPLGGIALIMIIAFVPKVKKAQPEQMDIWGQFLLALVIFSIMSCLQNAPMYGWANSRTLFPLSIIFIAILAEYFVEKHASHPIIDLKLFTLTTFRGAIISDFLLAFFYSSALLIIPEYLTQSKHQTITTNGLYLLLISVPMGISSIRIGKLIDKKGTQLMLTTGFLGFTLSAIFLTLETIYHRNTLIIMSLILFGISWAILLNSATIQAMSSVPPERTGYAVGASWTFHNLGGALGAFTVSLITIYYSGNFSATTQQIACILITVSIIGSVFSRVYSKIQ